MLTCPHHLHVQGVAGILFFWTYMLLVFLVLLNFLLAIIVDAFSEVGHRRGPHRTSHKAPQRLVDLLGLGFRV